MSDGLSRRQLLKRAGQTGVAAVGVAGLAAYFHGRPGWPPPNPRIGLRDWRVAEEGVAPNLVIARGPDAARLTTAALEEMGGMKRFVDEGDVVLVKPNAAFDRPAWQGATTNPGVVGAVVAACRDAGAREVIVTDNPIHAPEGCFRKSGIGRAAEDAGGDVLLPAKGAFGPVRLDGTLLDGWEVLVEPLLKADKVIGIAPVKDHNLALASMTMKNWYGLLGGPRNRLHQRMDETIATLTQLIRPTLCVLDGSIVMRRNGPTGGSVEDLERHDTLAISTDNVAIDAFGATLLDLTPDDLPYLRMAEAAGTGVADWRSLDPREITA